MQRVKTYIAEKFVVKLALAKEVIKIYIKGKEENGRLQNNL